MEISTALYEQFIARYKEATDKTVEAGRIASEIQNMLLNRQILPTDLSTFLPLLTKIQTHTFSHNDSYRVAQPGKKKNNNTEDRVRAMRQFQALPKFEDALDTHTETVAAGMRNIIYDLADSIIRQLQTDPAHQEFQLHFKHALSKFDIAGIHDTDKELICDYYDQIAEMIGFDRMEHILNEWLSS